MRVALGEEEIVPGCGVAMWHPIDVSDDLGRVIETRHLQLAFDLGEERCTRKKAEHPHHHGKHEESHQDSTNPSH